MIAMPSRRMSSRLRNKVAVVSDGCFKLVCGREARIGLLSVVLGLCLALSMSKLFGPKLSRELHGARRTPPVLTPRVPAEHVQQQRKPQSSSLSLADHVKWKCQTLKKWSPGYSSFNTGLYENILVNDKHKVLYCPVPKVACSNWKRVMLALSGDVSGVSDPLSVSLHDVHFKYQSKLRTLGAHYTKGQTLLRFRKYFKFMVVRHPLERLVSAWRDKFRRTDSPDAIALRKRYVEIVLRKMRYKNRWLSADLLAKLVKQDGWKPTVTFSEFLQLVLDPDADDVHWQSYDDLCHPCHVRYDFISNYDSLEADASYVLGRVHARHIQFPKRDRSAAYRKPSTDLRYVKRHFAHVPASVLERIHEKYRTDFELFNFSLPPFLKKKISNTRKHR